MKRKFYCISVAVIVALTIFRAFADGRADRAFRGSVCNISNATSNTYKGSLNKMLLSWRMLPGDNVETAFDLYRSIDGEEETKINDKPVKATNFQDTALPFTGNGDVTYRLTYAGSSGRHHI